jgi:hypothetical protein
MGRRYDVKRLSVKRLKSEEGKGNYHRRFGGGAIDESQSIQIEQIVAAEIEDGVFSKARAEQVRIDSITARHVVVAATADKQVVSLAALRPRGWDNAGDNIVPIREPQPKEHSQGLPAPSPPSGETPVGLAARGSIARPPEASRVSYLRAPMGGSYEQLSGADGQVLGRAQSY